MSRVESGKLNVKRDQLFKTGETLPARLFDRPLRAACKQPPMRLSSIHVTVRGVLDGSRQSGKGMGGVKRKEENVKRET